MKTSKPAKYVFSDCHPAVLELLKENIAVNLPGQWTSHSVNDWFKLVLLDCQDLVSVEKLDWSNVSDGSDIGHFDLIMAADVVYDPEVITHLVHTLAHCLRLQTAQLNTSILCIEM